MNKETEQRPAIVCHMVASIDGRIDCAMVDKISGDEYYSTLEQLDCQAYLNGRVTMEHYNAEKEPFVAKDATSINQIAFYVSHLSEKYAVSVDTHGKLAFASNEIDSLPLICIVSEQASKEYLDYLQKKEISWIACGKTEIDLALAVKILGSEFGVKRLAVLGGGIINGGFLKAGLIDEVSLLLAPGIDGRSGRVALFDGIENTPRDPFQLKLNNLEQLDGGTVWLRYNVVK